MHLIAMVYIMNGDTSRIHNAYNTFVPELFVVSLYLCLMRVCFACSTRSFRMEWYIFKSYLIMDIEFQKGRKWTLCILLELC